jgi:hypothetical protein
MVVLFHDFSIHMFHIVFDTLIVILNGIDLLLILVKFKLMIILDSFHVFSVA